MSGARGDGWLGGALARRADGREATPAPGGLRAGYAAVEITPPVGIDLTGFVAREGPCTGTRDPLWARALVFESAPRERGSQGEQGPRGSGWPWSPAT